MLILLSVHPKKSTWYQNETGSEHVSRFEESKDHNNREEKLSWDMKREVVPLIRREKHWKSKIKFSLKTIFIKGQILYLKFQS